MTSADPAGGQRVSDPLAVGVDWVSDLSLVGVSDEELVELVRRVECEKRRLAAVEHRLAVELAQRSIPAKVGARGVSGFLVETLRIPHAEASARAKAAKELGPRVDMAGEVHPPLLPATAAALAEGAISMAHAQRISAVLAHVPGSVDNPEFEATETLLAGLARTLCADDIPAVGDKVLAYLDPDGRVTDDKDRARMRGVTVGRQRPDGMSVIRGELSPTLRGLWDTFMAKYARPGMNNPDDPDSPRGACDVADREAMVAAATRDTRTVAQRQHDALAMLLDPQTRVDELGEHRGLPVSMIMTVSVEDLERKTGVATTATGGTIPISEALRLAEHADPYLLVFDKHGLPLHFARKRRLASASQRLALTAALRGCTRPGCDAPASMCAVHHVSEWHAGGATDIENLTLACDHCHSLVNDGPNGWKTVVLGKDSRYPGRTGWIAPPHIDPTRTPRVNHRHHPGELLARALSRIHHRNNHDQSRHRDWPNNSQPPTDRD
ncbi:HNH endonuclease signature motif containing protein [Nocardia arthritidis]|uniref:DUF222 domain-containing protein n=1 Tax=Nocardia arthritidis TaxID=228602 RepID=A0A6G9YEW0_9NOCA|nr:HNH endonuclease signature motif containing protein [Nocardia arthritidis]QIS11761.1 DUF222 domain-containing protein [Nocardia arthritidis]